MATVHSSSLGVRADSNVAVRSEDSSFANIVPFRRTVDEEYLCYFYHRHLDFRIPEVESLAEMAGVCSTSKGHSLCWRKPHEGIEMAPMWYLRLPSEDAARFIAERSILVKGFLEVWGEGADWEELEKSIMVYSKSRRAAWSGPHLTWKIVVEGWGLTIRTPEQVDIIERLSYLDFKGRIRLSNPDVTFHLILMDVQEGSGLPRMASWCNRQGAARGLFTGGVLLQVLTARYSRRLITMEKVRKYDADEAARYHEALGPPVMAIDDISTIIYEERRKEEGPVHVRPSAKRRFRSKLT
eukprot:jgi/Botrbrau1/16671/Bobra.0068s0087.1